MEVCCESKSTLHPPPRARLCLRLRHMSRHRRLERTPVTLHTQQPINKFVWTQFSHFPRKWHHSLVIVSSHRAYYAYIGCVMCGGVWLNLLSHVGPLRSKQREWEKCTFMWSPNEIISGELVRWGIHYRSASHYRLVLLWSALVTLTTQYNWQPWKRRVETKEMEMAI